MTPDDLPPSFQKASLVGKIAVVTGSTQGLGEATARLFRDRGCKGLVLTGRSAERGKILANELTTDSCLAVFVRADLEDLDEVRNIFRVTDMTFGTVHILVNAAATTDRGSLWDTTPDDYNRIMNVNTRAPFFLMQDAARIMEREKVAGSIINISSTASYGSMPMIAAYGMSKGALNVATKNFAYSLMWSKIRVNALAIGWMDTPGEDAIQRRLHCGSSEENWKEAGEANQPFGRLLSPEEVARCIAFCASEESGMMTGCVIDFDQSVWGAGNAPVPPPKEEWAKAHGMTFSFQDGYTKRKSKTATAKAEVPVEPKAKSKTSAKEDFKESKKTTPRSTPKSSPKATPKTSSSPKEEKKKKRSKSNTPRSSSRARREDLKKSRDESKKSREESKKSTPRSTPKSSPKNSPKPSPKSGNTGYILNASRAKMGSRRPPPPPPPVTTVVVPGEDPVASEPEKQEQAILDVGVNKQDDEKVILDVGVDKSDDQKEKEVEPTEKEVEPTEKETKSIEVAMVNEEKKLAEITPPVTPETESPKLSMEQTPEKVPYPDETRPSPTEFKQMLEEKQEMNLNDSPPGAQKQAEFAKKKFGSSHSDNSSSHGDNNDYLPSSLSPKTTRKTVLPPKSPDAPQRKLQDIGEVIRPDEFFAENNPYGRKKERNNKKPLSRSSDHGDYRAARVQDWLGGDVGKAQRRSYKVKNVRELSSETSGD